MSNLTLASGQPGRVQRSSVIRLCLLFSLLLPFLASAQTFSGASHVTGTVGCPLTYQVVASGNVTAFSCSALPAGLTMNGNTGLIVGVPTATASVDVTVHAATGSGSGADTTLHFDINAAVPLSAMITGATDLRATSSGPFSYQILATNNATAYTCSPVPTGFSFNSSTGLLTGNPDGARGVQHLTISAQNPVGSSTTTLTLRLNGPAAPTITGCNDDTGIPGDRITSDLTLTLSGTAEANAKVTVSENGNAFASVQADANGNWSCARPDSGYANARLNFTATATDALGNTSPASGVFDMLLCSPLRVNNLSATVDAGGAVRIDLPILDAQGRLDVQVTGLPAGLTFNATDRTITGSVAGSGTFTIGINATAQNNASGTITLNVTANNSVAAPTNLSASAQAATQVTLNWADNAGNENGCTVERSTDGVNFNAVATVNANATTCTDSSVAASTTYYYRVRAFNASAQSSFSNVVTVTTPALSPTGNPVITLQPASIAAALGGRVTLNAGASGSANATFQWRRNGIALNGATSATLTLDDVNTAKAGIYTAAVTDGGTTITVPAIVGVTANLKAIGFCREIAPDIRHPNGNVYDQLLLEGDGAGLTADAGQVTRLSFCDLNGDIVQVEFSGAGTLSIALDNATSAQVAANYNQPAVAYVKGHATIVVTGANESTNLSVFTVGKLTAIDQSLFKADVNYDGVADIAAIAILSANGKFGGLRAANVSCFSTKGTVGVLAPGVQFTGPCYIGNISAYDQASAVLQLGGCDDVRVAGGDMLQANGTPVSVSGVTRLQFVTGTTSNGRVLAATNNKARFDENGVDVTAKIVVNPSP